MNPFVSIALAFLRAYWLPIVIALAMSLVAYKLHHAGYVAGVQSQQVKIDRDENQLRADVDSFHRITGAIEANKTAARAQAEQAAAAVAQARKVMQAHDRAAQSVLSAYRKAKPVQCADELLPDGVTL
jgi:hypothetical protein